MTPIERLRRLLAQHAPGTVSDPAIAQALAEAWDDLEGSDSEAMRSDKVARAEGLAWQSPVLSFTIERHGASTRGSTRAELQDWHIDVEAGTATLHLTGRFRQLTPAAPRWDAKPVAEELADAILARSEHPHLMWSSGGRVRVKTGEVIPAGYKETVEGRRKRLYAALAERLEPAGWQRQGQWWSR